MAGVKPPIGWDEGWDVIQRMCQKLFRAIEASGGGAVSIHIPLAEYMKCYQMTYEMCTQRAPGNFSGKMYEGHIQVLQQYATEVVLPSLQRVSGMQLLKELDLRYQHHKIINKWMHKFLQYLDRYHAEHYSVPPLLECSRDVFKRHVYDGIRVNFTAAVIGLINAERDGERVDRDLLKRTVEIYQFLVESKDSQPMDIYQRDFQIPLLDATRDYYERKATAWIHADSVPVYLAKVEEVMTGEVGRVEAYMHQHTMDLLLRLVADVLLAAQQETVLHKPGSGLLDMLDQNKLDDLARLYRLYSRALPNLNAVEVGLAGGMLPAALMPPAPPAAAALGTGRGLHLGALGGPSPTALLKPIAAITQDYFTRLGGEIVRDRDDAAWVAAGGGVGGGGGGGTEGGSGNSAGGGAGAQFISMPGGGKEPRPEKESADNPEFVRRLLDLHDRARRLVAAQFQGNSLFQKMLKDSFETIVNKSSVHSKFQTAEVLAHYVDRVLQAKDKMDEVHMEEEMERVVGLFNYVSDKDLFGEVYRGLLSKRLLSGKSTSSELERSMISKLKLACGALFTNKMEGMLNDLLGQEKADAEFGDFCARDKRNLPFAFSTQVLTSGWWPSALPITLTLPPPMEACIAAYQAWYAKEKQNKKLQWSWSQGTATVKGSFLGGKMPSYEITVNTLQAVALMAFNVGREAGGGEGVTVDSVARAMGVQNVEVVKRVLHSLACSKQRVLKKTPDNAVIREDHTFVFNASFSSPAVKFRIPMPSLEDSHNPKKLEDERVHTIEAAIVRIMKARKQLTHGELVALVMSQLQFFSPSGKAIKKRIEDLIERDYLSRAADSNDKYNYVA